MLAVDRDEPGAVGGAGPAQERTGADEALLVGEGEHAAVARELEPRREARGADDGRHAPIDGLRGSGAKRFRSRLGADPAAGKRGGKVVTPGRVCRDRDAGAEAASLVGEKRDIAAASERDDLVALAAALRLEERHRVLPDRAGRAQDGNFAAHDQEPITPMPRASQIPKNQTPPMIPSSRSITPPCPGMRALASLTPKRRLTALSRRSPA